MHPPLNSNSCSPVEWGCEMGSCTGGEGGKKSHMRSRTPVHVHILTRVHFADCTICKRA